MCYWDMVLNFLIAIFMLLFMCAQIFSLSFWYQPSPNIKSPSDFGGREERI